MKWEWMLREARETSEAKGLKIGLKQGLKQGIEQYKEDTILSSLEAKLPIQLIAKIARTTDEKVRETAKKHNLENLIVNN
ncbi:MAG: hypothetical protein SPJ72_04905 [Succinivibrio sp.]|nr:hypothetical protein [Succinivibrio sp.]MDY5904424.1 hypothetical protein [Succinivibrio sp.]